MSIEENPFVAMLAEKRKDRVDAIIYHITVQRTSKYA